MVGCTLEWYVYHPCQKAHPIMMVWWQSAVLCKNLFKLPLQPQEATETSQHVDCLPSEAFVLSTF